VAFTHQGESAAEFAALPGVRESESLGERVTLHTSDADATVRALVASSIPWKELEVKSNDLEEIFITLVQKAKGAKA
jgi:ABC-2 type transport system ATP-binding protein